MTYRNGYTSTPEILAMKKEIRKIKIDINRLASITLDYADEITDNDVVKGRLPKPIEHILVATKHMNERIEELAKKNSKADKDDKIIVVYCKKQFIKKDKGMKDGEVKINSINSYKITI
jgi:hypothetical protein